MTQVMGYLFGDRRTDAAALVERAASMWTATRSAS